MPFSKTASHHHGASRGLDNAPIGTRRMNETMDAVEMNLDRLKLSLQKRYAELVSSQIDRLMDRAGGPNRKVCVNFKSREIRRLGTSGLDDPVKGSGSEKVETADQAGVESESKDVKTPEITRIRIRQYRKIEHSDGENPVSTYSTDQDVSDVNKIAHEHITFREKVIGQLSAGKDKSSGLSDSVSAFKAAVPHSEISTYKENNLSENVNKRPMSATHPIESPQITSEHGLTTKDNRSPILSRNYARSTTPAFTITVRPVREDNSTKSKNDASPLAESHPSRSDAGSQTSSRRDGASPINKYDSRSPVLGRSRRATPSNIYSARSPALGRSGETSSPLHRYDAKSPILGRSSRPSPLSRYNDRSPALGLISGASSPLNRYDAKNPILGRSSGSSPLNRYNARSPTLGRLSGASSPLNIYDAKSQGLDLSSESSPLNRHNAKGPALDRISGVSPPLHIYDAKSPASGRNSEATPFRRYKVRSPASDRGSQTSPSPNKCDSKNPALGQSRESSPINRYKARSRSLGRNSEASSPLHRYDAKRPVLGRSSEASPLNEHNARRSASDRRSESSPSPNKYDAKSPVLGRNTGDNRDDIIRQLAMRNFVERSPLLTRTHAENSTSAMIGSIGEERAAIPMARSRLNSPASASARRETESPKLPRSRLNSPASARRETESPTLPRRRLNSPTPTRRGTECPTLPRSLSNSPTSGREDIENHTLQKCHFNSPTSPRRGSESPTLPRSRFTSSTPARRGTESHTLTKRSLNSPTPTRRGTESPTLPRSRSNSPILARRDTESSTLTKSRLNSPAPIRRGTDSHTLQRSRLNSQTPTKRVAESDTLPRSPLNSPISVRKSTESRTLSGSRLRSPTSARRGAESHTLPSSRLNSPTSTNRVTESLTLALTRRNSKSPVWKEYLGYNFVNDTNSAALISPTSTMNHVKRRLQKMVDRLEFYNRSVSPKMEKIKESLSPRKPLRNNYIRPAMHYYVEEPNETVETTRSARRMKQEMLPSFDDTSMTDTRENIEHSIFTSSLNQNTNTFPSRAAVKKEKYNFEEHYHDDATDRMVVVNTEYSTSSSNTLNDRVGINYSRKGKSNQSFDVDNSFKFKQQRKTEPQTEFRTLISPVSDDQPSETRDIVRRLVFNSPTQSSADSPVASESGNSRAVCLFRKYADESENKMSSFLQNESRKDKGQYLMRSTKQSGFKKSAQLQNDSRNLGQHRRPAEEIEFKTSTSPIQIQRCPNDRSTFQQNTVSDNTVFSSSLQQSSENSTFLYDSLDEIDQQPLAHSTPIPEDRTQLFSPISPNNELQPDDIQETRPVIAGSEEYCACCRDKEIKEIELFRNAITYRSQSNQNEDNYQLDKIKKSEHSTRMERSRDYHNKINTIPNSSKDTIKDFALSVYTKRVENEKEPSGKQDHQQMNITFKPKENGSRFEELVKYQLHQLRDPNDQQNNIIGRKTKEIKESESKEITNYDNGNQANDNEEKHVTFAVIRKRIFPVDNECQASITQAQQHARKRIEKVNFPRVKDNEDEIYEEDPINHQTHRADGQQRQPVTPGTKKIEYHKNSALANHTPKEQEKQKLVKQRILQTGLDTEKGNIENIDPEEKTVKPIQAAGSQTTNIFTSKTKEIKQYGNGNLANFKSLEIQTRSSTGSQTEILREGINIHRSEQSSQTEVYIHSEKSIKHTQFTNTEEYSIDTNTENIKAESVEDQSKEDEAEEEDGDNESDNRKTTDSAKAAEDDFQRELLRALSANVHRLYEDIERVISSNALPRDDIPPETIINEAEYMLLNRIETLLSLCNNMDRNEFREKIEELICRLHVACFEQGARSRDSDYMDEMRTVLDGLTILKENLAVGRERLRGEKSGTFGPSGFIATANKKFKKLLEYYNANKDNGTRIIRRIGQRTGLERLPAYLQRHLYKVVLVLGILYGIVIVIYGPSVARTMSDFIFSRFMYVMCNVRLIHHNPPIV